jgi:hypothetical protein
MALTTTESTTLAVVFRARHGRVGARAAEVGAVTDSLRYHADVNRCSSSLALGDEAATDRAPALVALITVVAPQSASRSLVDEIAPMLDRQQDLILEVDERPIVTTDRTWPLASPTPGEQMVSLVTRAPSFTRDAFAAYWRDVHAPVALSFTILPSVYTQYVTRRSWFGDDEPDGVFLMHFLSAQDRADRWARHPDEAARGATDAAVFMDLARASSALMRETIWR